MKFKKQFSKNLTAVATVVLPIIKNRGMVAVEWNGTPTHGILPRYQKWMFRIHQWIADHVQGKILYVMDKHEGLEAWEFSPGEPPKQIRPLRADLN